MGDNEGKHGVSAMNGRVLLKGRPRGGAAIIWKGIILRYFLYLYICHAMTIDPIRILLSVKVF